MRIFLAGASGFVGSRVLDDLLARGHEVTAHAHTERSRQELLGKYPSLSVVVGDVVDPAAMLRAVPPGTEAVIYLPGLLREFPRKGISFQKAHVEGCRNVMAAAKRAGAQRWIELSALGAGPHAKTPYFRTKWEAEEHVRASGLDWTILRPSIIVDDRPSNRKNFVGEIAKAIRELPFIPILGNGKYRMQPVSVDDVSQTIMQALEKPGTIGKTYEMGGPEKLTYLEIVRVITGAMKVKKPRLYLPMWLCESLAFLFQTFFWFPFTVDQLVMLKQENIVKDPAKDREWREMFDLSMKHYDDCVRKALTSS
jgi:uncharacterized protein YbjT (DUF2867 family)